MNNSERMIKTVLELDLVSYSDVASILEEHLDVHAVKAFQDQIQSFVDSGLEPLGLKREEVVFGTAGDNALLFFDDAPTAHRFSELVHRASAEHNSKKDVESAKRWFRIGAATGAVLVIESERRIVGTTVTRAVRLESAAKKGQLLIDTQTFDALPDEMKAKYEQEETISGKRDERYTVRRCTFINGITDYPNIPSTVPQSIPTKPIRVTVHFACFSSSGLLCFFINVTNISRDINVEVTHVWMETTPQVFAKNIDRPLPKRLVPSESWETWIPAHRLPKSNVTLDEILHSARVRISTGDVIASIPNSTVPAQGVVPGGLIQNPLE